MGSDKANAYIEELKRDAEKGELLLWASARGLTADVIELVQAGADPCTKDKHLRQAVHYAASNGHLEILEFLFTKGVPLDVEDDVGREALHYAAAGGHVACVSFLLGKECWRDVTDAADDTPLHLAARSGHVATITALLAARAKPALVNKRSLTPFAEAVLAGRSEAAAVLGASMEGGLSGALAQTYREVPLLHLAAGLGQVAAVEWLVKQQKCDISATATEGRYTPLHAAALSGDIDTVAALLRLGADPLAQTVGGKLPLELVPKAAPPIGPPPSAAVEGAVDPSGTDASVVKDRRLVRSARKAFQALARAAAEQGGVDLGTAAPSSAAVVKNLQVSNDAAVTNRGADEGAEFDTPAAICLRQLLSMTFEKQIAKVESYAKMDERKLQELSYLDMDAQVALTALRQAMGMVEVFSAIAALRADDDFQSDIRDPAVQDALAEAKRTNDLSRYEERPAVMSVAAKFKRLHAVTRKAGGLQVVIEDLRAELPGHDPASTAAKMEEMRAAERAAAEAAVKAVMASVTAAVPACVRERLKRDSAADADATATAAAAAASGSRRTKGKGDRAEAAAAVANEGRGDGCTGDDEEFKARMVAQKERLDKLRAAATSAWSSSKAVDNAMGYMDRLEKEFKAAAARAEGKLRWRLADYLGDELAQSVIHTLKALAMTAIVFLIMWMMGLMPQQQAAKLLARQELLRVQNAEREMAARFSQLEGLGEHDGSGGDGGGGGGGDGIP